MTLEDALSYIHRVDWRGSVPGLSRIDTLLGMLGHPERSVKYIHITGTNGKGSTCAMLAAILRQAGYKTGLYTSPYIFRFNERMQINGTPISDDALCALVEELQPLADSMADHPTEFELVTAMALTWFARERCDIVVCEVGMGGEFDATNVIPAPEAAVLCSIGLDHTEVLGDTLEKIAATKSGIIKSGCDAVLYRSTPGVEAVVEQRCREAGAPLHKVDFSSLHLRERSLEGQVFDFGHLTELHLPLLGEHQLHNAAVALTTLAVLQKRGWHISEEDIRQGLSRVTWPGRFQIIRRDPLFLIDGGHNPQCIQALAQNITDYLPNRPLTVLTGVLGDKDYHCMYRSVADHAAEFITVTPDNPRALTARELAGYLSSFGKPVTPCDTVADGVRLALAHAGKDGTVLCYGSLYLLGDVIHAVEES